jgi:protein SCO1/2
MPNHMVRRVGFGFALASLAGLGAAAVFAADEAPADPHAAHHRMMANQDLRRSVAEYAVPSLQLVRDDGAPVDLGKELADSRVVVLNFIYTTCTTICPLSSQVFGALQERLGSDSARVHLVSISIDPEQDTPARLREYAHRFHAGPGWQHYTGSLQASIAAQQAFGAYRGDKMNHSPLTLIRTTPGGQWVRFDGFTSSEDLYAEIRGTLMVAR